MSFKNSAQVYVSTGLPLSARVLKSSGLMYLPENVSQRSKSTDVYAVDDWSCLENIELYLAEKPLKNLQDGLSIFEVSEEVIELLKNANFDAPLEEALLSQIHACISQQISLIDEYILDNTAIMLTSYQGRRTGNTTNGFHFDDGEGTSLRVGINLGDVSRNVYFVPEKKEIILSQFTQEVSKDQLYPAICHLGLSPLSVTVHPGEGWILPTKEFLHDGRRKESNGLSKFILMSADFKG